MQRSTRTPRLRGWFGPASVGLLLATVLANAAVAAAESPHGQLPTLVNASQIHGLTSEQAARGYPVRLRVIVTYYDCYLDPAHPNFFVSDETGAIFVIQASNRDLHLHPGEVIEVSGVTGPGNFAPIVDHATVRLVGSSPLPDRAIHVTRGQLLTGRYDAQWVSVEGIVHSAKDFGDLHKDVILKIASSDGLISAVTVKDPVTNYDALIDARVMIHANAASRFNRNRQMVGVRLLFPGPRCGENSRRGASGPFSAADPLGQRSICVIRRGFRLGIVCMSAVP